MKKWLFILFLIPSLVAAQVPRFPFYKVPTTGTTGAAVRWDFENNGIDEEGNYNLTAVGGATYGTSSPLLLNSYWGSLNGSGKYFSVPSFDYTSTFSISCWVYIYTASGIKTVYGALSESIGFDLKLYYDLDDIWFATGGTPTIFAKADNVNLVEDAWMHIVVVVNKTNGTATIYLNGSDVTDSETIRTDFTTTTAAQIGSELGGSYWIYGRVDDIQIYLWELTAANVTTLYNNPGTEVYQSE